MAAITLNKAETRLCERAASGVPIEFSNSRTIRAEVLRCLLLRLPVNGAVLAAPSAVGLIIVGATIQGRLDFNDCHSTDGGALPPIEFRNCLFEGGFCAAHGHLSRLALIKCRFRDPQADTGAEPPLPTIDLTGAQLDSDLGMHTITPARARDRLWIRAIGIRVDGELDLSSSKLRCPPERQDRLLGDPATAALDLTRADIRGDFKFFRGASEGAIKARSAHIRGDLWMSGATIENPDGDALFFQAITVDGVTMLDSRPDAGDGSGETRLFKCFGNLNLTAANLGHDLEMRNSIIRGTAKLFDLSVKNDFRFGAHVEENVLLPGCRIGGSLLLSELTLGAEAKGLSLESGRIERSLQLLRPSETERPNHDLLAARRARLRSLPEVDLVETLWEYEQDSGERELAQIGFLVRGDDVYRLDGHDGVLNAAVARFGHAVGDVPGAVEYLRLYCTYVQDAKGACPFVDGAAADQRPPSLAVRPGRSRKTLEDLEPRLLKVEAEEKAPGFAVEATVLHDDRLHRRKYLVTPGPDAIGITLVEDIPSSPVLVGLPRFDGALLRHPKEPEGEAGGPPAGSPWVTQPTIPSLAPLDPRELEKVRQPLTRHMFSSVSLRGVVILDNLYCDVLDDHAGSYWGRDVQMMINHFFYNRTTWEKGSYETRIAAPLRLWASFSRAVRGLILAILSPPAERLGLAHRLPATEPLRPWQVKLDWIYQQFDTTKVAKPTRYTIGSAEYRPQPFEQAIKVARAEGRDDYAIHFEVTKRNIEWRLFTHRHRGRFILLGLAAATAWIVLADNPFSESTLATAGLLFLAFIFISDVFHFAMRVFFGHLRRPIRAIATLVGAFLLGWAGVDAANDRGMLVVDVAPVAGLVREEAQEIVIGSQRSAKGEDIASNVPCRRNVNEALYALDVLIPLIDLREESRCEVGDASSATRTFHRDDALGALENWQRQPSDFWDVLKALYAIAGWFIVSLSILTFANTTRSRTEV
jgi:hypothetical protein